MGFTLTFGRFSIIYVVLFKQYHISSAFPKIRTFFENPPIFKIVDKRKVVPWMYGITVLVGAFGIAQEVEYLPVFTSNFWIFMISGLLIGMAIKCLGFNWFFVWRRDAKPFLA